MHEVGEGAEGDHVLGEDRPRALVVDGAAVLGQRVEPGAHGGEVLGVHGREKLHRQVPIVRNVASGRALRARRSVAGPDAVDPADAAAEAEALTAGGAARRSPAGAPWRRSAPAARRAARPGRRPARAPGRAVPVQNSPVKSSASSPLSCLPRRSRTQSLKPSWISACRRFRRSTSSGFSSRKGSSIALLLARGVHAPLDAEACDQVLEAETRARSRRSSPRSSAASATISSAAQASQ